MIIKPLRDDLVSYLVKRQLVKKWQKARQSFEQNIRHPSLQVELLEPQWRGIYSFRLDQKYRALFFIDSGKAEVFQITNHYKR